MKRREFVGKLGVGSAGLAAASALGSVSAVAAVQHDHQQSNGPLASAIVVFGAWRVEPALDRFPNLSPRTANEHRLMPYVATIKAGGSVSFVISGLHNILVYAPGTTMDSIDETLIVEAVPGVFPGFIDDPANRIYRGLDPRPLPQDRVESVTLSQPGTYLVTCAAFPRQHARLRDRPAVAAALLSAREFPLEGRIRAERSFQSPIGNPDPQSTIRDPQSW